MRNDKHWVETLSGKRFDLIRPRAIDVVISDIAAALSKTARFNGHTKGLLSVAQHLINTASILAEWGEPPVVQLAGFSHDFPEAYIHDVAKPLKELLPEYQRIERKVERAIWKGLHLDEVLCLTKAQWKTVKRADEVMLLTERRDFKAKTNYQWHQLKAGLKPWARRIPRRSWWSVEQEFLETWERLRKAVR